jgi:hypothetical protein
VLYFWRPAKPQNSVCCNIGRLEQQRGMHPKSPNPAPKMYYIARRVCAAAEDALILHTVSHPGMEIFNMMTSSRSPLGPG